MKLNWPEAVVLSMLTVAGFVSYAYVATAETRAQAEMMESMTDDPCLIVLFHASMMDEVEPVSEYMACKNATTAEVAAGGGG